MNAEQFYHVCRSAAAIANVRDLTVFGAAAVVPWIARDCPGAPFWGSMELDLDPGNGALAELVDGSIGELSLFEETFGVRAHGITIDAFIAPPDWPARAAFFFEPTEGGPALRCPPPTPPDFEPTVRIRSPHPLDLVVAKLVRGDDRDWAFAAFCRDPFRLSVDAIAAGLAAVASARRDYAPAAEGAASLLPHRLGS